MTWNDGKQLSKEDIVQQSTVVSSTEGLFVEESSDEPIDGELLTETHRSLSCQTDIMELDLDRMEREK